MMETVTVNDVDSAPSWETLPDGVGGPSYAGKPRPIDAPVGTILPADHRHLISPFLAPRYGERDGQEPRTHAIDRPMPTIVPTANGGSLVVGHMINLKGSDRRDGPMNGAVPTVCAGGFHIGEVRTFLVKYFGSAIGQGADEPLHTVTSKARFGLVTIAGVDYQIVDIGMRMLMPRELFRAQGFPESYIIDRGSDGVPLSKTAQIRMCGNSVCPPVAEALVRANFAVPAEEAA